MKVLIACSVTPFADSPVQQRARLLCRRLVEAGHEAEILRVPFAAEPAQQLPSQLVMMRSLETWNVDHLLALDLPASLLRHPRKTLWLGAQLPLAPDADASLRMLLGNAARGAMAESRAAFHTSHRARDVLRAALGLELPVLPLAPRNVAGMAGEYILAAPPRAPGDVRLLSALARAAPGVRLLVAGQPAAGQQDLLHGAARALGVEARVRLDLRPLSEHDMDGYLAGALAVACIGGADDIALALAAAGAGKPAIADADTVNLEGIVRPYLSGWLVPGQPAGLAAGFDQAWSQPHRALAYGARARDLLPVVGADWPHTLNALLA